MFRLGLWAGVLQELCIAAGRKKEWADRKGFCFGLASGGGAGEDGVEGSVFEEADLEANGDDLAEVGGGGQVFAAGAEMREAEVTGTGEFQA